VLCDVPICSQHGDVMPSSYSVKNAIEFNNINCGLGASLFHFAATAGSLHTIHTPFS